MSKISLCEPRVGLNGHMLYTGFLQAAILQYTLFYDLTSKYGIKTQPKNPQNYSYFLKNSFECYH